jgi:nucleoside-diphosphate-sugar epimerase
MAGRPEIIASEEELDALLTEPTQEVERALAAVEGDVLILGVAGKMGPTLAQLARRAVVRAGLGKRVIGVSRFSSPEVEQQLRVSGVETIACDLLAERALDDLPDAANVIFMVGRKFGTSAAQAQTWAANSYLPGLVTQRYRTSRLVVLSSGNVYPLVPVTSGGATERQPPAPIGEYAQSCLGRERVCEYFSRQYGTPMAIIRLNYAIDLRYGVLLEVATRVWAGEPIDVTMGNVNVIWQGDANRVILQALRLCTSPPDVLNVTGPETVSIRHIATRFAELFGRPAPLFSGEEAPTALLSNAQRAHSLFGYPAIPLERMLRWVAHWVMQGGRTWDKATHFEVRDGNF